VNLHFLNPHFLWALPLSFLPILLHFLLKKPVKVLPFGDLRLLRKIVLKSSPRRKFEEWLILFLRVLTLLTLVLFFSRPVFHFGALAGQEGDSISLILLLDSSYSMQKEEKGIKIFDQAKNLAEKILTQLKVEDRSCLIVYSDKIVYFSGILNNEHQELIQTLQNLKCTYMETEILSPLNQAYQILSESPSANKAILVLSDLAKHGWEETQVENLKDFDPNVRLVFLKIVENLENASIQKAQIFHDLSSNFLKTEVDVRNWGSKALTLPISVEYFSKTNEFLKRKAEQLLNLSPFESQKVSITASENEPNITGRIVLGSDILETDNNYYFAQEFPEKIKILMVEEHAQMTALTGESYFLRQAYLTPPTPFELKTITLGEIKNENLKSFNMIFLIAPSLISEETAQELKEFVKGGGSLWISLGERTTPHNLTAFDDLLPCSFNQTIEPKALSLVLKSSQDDPDFNALKSEYDWDKIQIYKMVSTVLKLNAEPLISLSDGTPYLIFSKDKKVAVWASSMDRSWNNLAGKPLFAPLLRKLALWSSQTNSFKEPFNLKVGEPFRIKAIPAWQNNSMTLLSPSQEKIDLHFSSEEIVSDPILEPGIYTLSGLDIKKGQFEKKFAVNLAKDKESDLKTIKEDDLKRIFPKAQWKFLETNEQFISDFFSYLKGKELNQVLILLSALFLLMEILLILKRNIHRNFFAIFIFFISCFYIQILGAVESSGNRFIFGQLKNKEQTQDWDPYPQAAFDILSFLTQTTSVKVGAEKRILTLGDPDLFESPFLVFTTQTKIEWSDQEREILKRYLSGGGFLLVEDRSGQKNGSFDYSFRQEMKKIFPEKSFKIIPRDHAIYRSFYLLRSIGGRKIVNNYFEGLEIDGRIALVYSQNDLLGAWAKDIFGNYLYECEPGKQAQRWESEKCMINIILYSLTGSYKTDKIHIPFIEEKLRR